VPIRIFIYLITTNINFPSSDLQLFVSLKRTGNHLVSKNPKKVVFV